MCRDKYTYSQIMTVGGLGGTFGTLYVVESPFSGDEYEYCVAGMTTGDVAGQYLAIVSGDQYLKTLAYDGSIAFGALSNAPFNFFKGQPYRLGPTQTRDNPSNWVRVTNGNKYVFIFISTPAASSMFASIQFRFLPVTVVPARQVTVPDTAEEQHNLARSEQVVKRLEMDIQEGDQVFSNYGKLR